VTDRGSSDTPSSVRQIAAELAVDFDTPVGTIEELVAGSFDELSDGARIDTYLRVLTKRAVRERLRRQGPSAA